MNYKELFQRLFTLIASPKKAWVEISNESPRRDVMGTFVYPLITLCGLVVLLSQLLNTGVKRMTFHTAAMDICGYCVAFLGGFFLAAWLIDLLRQRLLDHTPDMPGSQFFTGYAMGAVFAGEILTVVFPQLFIFKWILQFYVLYIVWEGSEVILNISEDRRLFFTTITSASIVFSPVIIRALFNMLSTL